MLVIHVFAFVAVMVVLWVMGDQAPAEETFFQFTDWSGWGNVGIAVLIGSGNAATSTLGSDSSAHLAEELKDAAWVLPRSMAVTAAVNYSLCFLIVCSLPQPSNWDLKTDYSRLSRICPSKVVRSTPCSTRVTVHRTSRYS